MPTVRGELEYKWRDLGAYIREQRSLGQVSLRKLSERAGISNPYLSQIERGLRKPSAEILQQIARALEISAETLYVRAGMLDERPDGVDTLTALGNDPYLTGPQRHALVRMYRAFRRENEGEGPTSDTAGGVGVGGAGPSGRPGTGGIGGSPAGAGGEDGERASAG